MNGVRDIPGGQQRYWKVPHLSSVATKELGYWLEVTQHDLEMALILSKSILRFIRCFVFVLLA